MLAGLSSPNFLYLYKFILLKNKRDTKYIVPNLFYVKNLIIYSFMNNVIKIYVIIKLYFYDNSLKKVINQDIKKCACIQLYTRFCRSKERTCYQYNLKYYNLFSDKVLETSLFFFVHKNHHKTTIGILL